MGIAEGGPMGRPAQRQSGGRIQQFCQILTFVLCLVDIIQVIRTCANDFAGADFSRPIGAAGTFPGIRENLSLLQSGLQLPPTPVHTNRV